MRRLVSLVVVLVMVPATATLGVELDELLEQGRRASYSADQVISCSTPDGARSALVHIEQAGSDLRVTSTVGDGVEVAAGSGSWSVSNSGGLVSSAAVDGGNDKEDPLYTVEAGQAVEFLGRDATTYRLIRDEVLRAELIFDDDTGALVQATTYAGDAIYCQRRFVSFDTSVPELDPAEPVTEPTPPSWVEDSSLPLEVAGFERLDHYVDDEGVEFAYYSDGLFSFALFETPTRVTLTSAVDVELGPGSYEREFSAGQVTYAWEILDGGIALVGDLPPDLHEAVLDEMPHPETPGFFRRWWRNLFG